MTKAATLAQMGNTNQTFRNRIINGAMVIDQRNAGASVTATNGYTVDRWGFYGTQSSKFTVQQNAGSVTPPAGFTNYLGLTSSSSYSVLSSDFFELYQIIEGYNIADLGWGTANAKSITLSFWVRSSLTGSFGAFLTNSGSTRIYPFSYTISAANTWTQITTTVTGDTSGTWLTTNGSGLQVAFGLGSGSNFNATAGAWTGTANQYIPTGSVSVVGTNGATFYITGVQLEAGTTATPFEYRQYGTELALCQRYCYVYYRRGASSDSNLALPGAGSFYSANGVYTNFVFPVTMRTTPTLITPNRTNAYLYPANSSSYSSDTVSMGHTHPQGCFITSTTSTSATGGFATNSTMATGGWVSGDYLGFSAEL